MPEKKEEDNGRININFDAGGVSFGGLFKGLGNLIDLATKLNEAGVQRSGEIGGLPRGAKGVYGLKISTLSGKPVIESFGNIRETARGPVVEEVREPMVDVFDEATRILVIVELPGVSEKEIKVEVSGDILNVTASGRERKYAREVLLPAKVKAEPLRKSFKNGVLEITLEKEA
jgi:HSP20 family protein